MREIDGADLMGGSDHEFVVNLYTVILNRWPDEDGYRHHLGRIENKPEMRRRVIEDVAGSPEARNLGVVLTFRGEEPAAPSDGAGDLVATLSRLRDGLGGMDPPALADAQRLLAETVAAVGMELAARVAR
ncbi:DUF4214 domain-containing protein [Roseomonas sp. PWR1]|uniref:DUF4214 domain-containing protein n=1 Tax=Roseomonas nitratireducens TaxID=2820810 RepID=A0ABS4AME1_9PROT|nr:DUF4214 domain-containing protein [Neoroseomonas nitratireducens]MBP0462404.1 DUF4214 domain-containing protein [Neoroseomonas nitratireducens]